MRNSLKSFYIFFLLLLLSIFFITCRKKTIDGAVEIIKPDLIFYAVNSNNEILKFNANALDTPLQKLAILNLTSTIVDIDFRPATGELYALTNTNQLLIFPYLNDGGQGQNGIIVTANGQSQSIGLPFTQVISGPVVNIDFNPTSDKIRIVTSSGENFRLNPETKVIATDGNINGVTGAAISGIAYSGNSAGSSNTVLYDMDITHQKLYKQTIPNNGTLTEIGSLGVTATAQGGFDISPDGVALAALMVNGESNLYQIDTASGKASLLGKIGSASPIKCIAIPTKPVAYAIDNADNLLIFDIYHPAQIISKPVTGLANGETLLGLDFQLGVRQLLALGSTSRIYTIDASSGVATALGTGPFSPLLVGTNFGFNYNAGNATINIISNTGQNISVDGLYYTVRYTSGPVRPGNPAVTTIAYTNNIGFTRYAAPFIIDHTTDKLYLFGNTEIGPLGIDIDATNCFDIGGVSELAYGIFTVAGSQGIYSVNLKTGKATKISDFNKPVKGFTVGTAF